MKDRLFADKAFWKRITKLTAPIVLQSLMLASVAVCDAFMLGNVNQNSMSAVSLATQVQFVQNIMLGAMISATSVLCAQYWGRKDLRSVNDFFCIALRLCTGVSLAVFAACVCIPETLMRVFTNETELIAIGADYLRIAGFSYLLTGISQCYLVILKISDHVPQAAAVSSGAVVMNIILNWAFIFGVPGLIPAMEVKGAAIATLISRVAELLALLILSFRKGYIHPERKRLFHRNRVLSADYRRCVLPLLGASLFWGIGFASYSAFMGHLGTDAAAANSVTAVIRDLICCLCDGLAGGAGIAVGNELGAGRLETGKTYGIRLMKMSYIIGGISVLIMLAATPLVRSMVELTESAAELMTGMMLVMAFYMIGRSVNTVIINGVFAAGGDTMFDMYSLAVCMWCVAVPLAALGTFVFHWHPAVVYACTCLDEVGKIPWVMLHFRRYKWVKDLTREMPAA